MLGLGWRCWWDGDEKAGCHGTGGIGYHSSSLSRCWGQWSSRYWGPVVKVVEDLVTIIIAVLVVLVIVFNTGGGEEKKRKAYLLGWACMHGYRDWGGLVVDVGTEIGGGDRQHH